MLKQERLDEVTRLINKITKLFYYETNIKPMSVRIEIVEDLYKRRLEFARSDEERKDIIKGEAFTRSSNGTTVWTKQITDMPYLLISENAIENNINRNQYLSTYIHELTHAHDFYDFALLNNLSSLEEMWECSEYRAFYFWTEYNAKRKAYYFYRKILNSDNSSSNAIEAIRNKECEIQINELRKEIIEYKNDSRLIMYCTIQFIGRFSVWNDLFPNYFNVNTLPNELILTFGCKVVNLYNFLYDNKNFNDIKFKFKELNNLLTKFM